MTKEGDIGPRFAIVLVCVFVATIIAVPIGVSVAADNAAERQVHDADKVPFFADDVRVGEMRLEAEIGFMSMNLTELGYFLAHNVTYQPDIYQYQAWKMPSLFVSEKGGDCEDYVLFALAVLNHSEYHLVPMVGTFEGVGHAWLVIDDHYLLSCQSIQRIDTLPPEFHAEHVYDDMLHVGLFG